MREPYIGRDGEPRERTTLADDGAHSAEACDRAVWYHARLLYAHVTGRGLPPEAPSQDMAVMAASAALCAAAAVALRYLPEAAAAPGEGPSLIASCAPLLERVITDDPAVPDAVAEAMLPVMDALMPPLIDAILTHRSTTTRQDQP